MKPRWSVGDRIGRLLLLEKTKNKQGKMYLWKCKCDCGSIIERTSDCFKNQGGTRSCGCLLREKITAKGRGLKDLTGSQFGDLTVIKISDKYDSAGHVKWECKCQCGTIKYHTGQRLKSGKVVSCGCYRRQQSTKRCKENHWNWKGGITDEQTKDRNSQELINWRNSVFERDKFTCKKCGCSKRLNAHHIKNFSNHKYLRFSLSNGITLCYHCHTEFHQRYGKIDNNEDQLQEFCNET